MEPKNLNEITAAELGLMLDIDRSLSREIIRYRRLFGSFTRCDQLHAVPGMTPEIVTKACKRLTIEVNDRKQQMMTIQLINTANSSYLGHHVSINFSRRSLLETPTGLEAVVWSGEQVAADCSAEGEVTFVLPHDVDLSASLYLRVFASDGTLLRREIIRSSELAARLVLEVEPHDVPAPRLPQFEHEVNADAFIRTLTTLVDKARQVGVQLIEAPVY